MCTVQYVQNLCYISRKYTHAHTYHELNYIASHTDPAYFNDGTHFMNLGPNGTIPMHISLRIHFAKSAAGGDDRALKIIIKDLRR